MESGEFIRLRKRIGKTQKEMAQLLGTSIKAIHSYEQGWRSIPAHVERHFLFLISRKRIQERDCWEIMSCPEERRLNCIAWEFRAGRLCWFVNGTICEGKARSSWREKMLHCRACEVLKNILV